MKRKKSLEELAVELVIANAAKDEAEAHVAAVKADILATMDAQKIVTTTIDTDDYGEALLTVVAPESSPVINHDKTRANLIKRYGQKLAGVVYKQVTTYEFDEAALTNLIENKQVRPSAVSSSPGAPRAKYLRLTIKKPKVKK